MGIGWAEVSDTKPILCVGQLVADILVHPVERVDFGVDTVCVESIRALNGGDAMNVAVNLARLGNNVRFAGRIGQDSFGDFLRGKLAALGIAHDSLQTDAVRPTSTTIVLVNAAGDRTFLHCAGANEGFCREDVREEWLPEDGIVFVGGTYILPGLDGAGTADLFAAAHKKRCVTAMDVTHDPSGRWLEVIRPCLAALDIFMPSIREAQAITGCVLPEDIADCLLALGVGTAVVKLGKEGCYVKNAQTAFYRRAYPTDAVDTTGAGDAFAAGFLAGLARGRSLLECAEMGCASGALTVRCLGATTDALSLENVQLRIQEGAV